MPPRAAVPPRDDDGDEETPQNAETLPPEQKIALYVMDMEAYEHDDTFICIALRLMLPLVPNHWRLVLDSGAVALVVSFLERHIHHEELMTICLGILVQIQYGLDDEWPAEDILIHQPTKWIAPVAHVMNEYQENEAIQTIGAMVLFGLTGDADFTTAFVESSAIATILFAMEKDSDDSKFMGAACEGIVRLLDFDDDGRVVDAIVEGGGLTMIVNVVKTHGSHSNSDDSSEAETLGFACEAIALMSQGRPSVAASIIDIDGMSILLSALKNQPPNSKFVHEVYATISRLGASDDAVEAFLAAGGIGTLIGLMKEHPDNDTIFSGTCLIFACLGDNVTHDVANALLEEGGLTAIVDAVPLHLNDESAQFLAFGALNTCLSVTDTMYVRDAIDAAPNVVVCIVEAMKKYAKQGKFQRLATSVLAGLSYSVKTCHDLVSSGGMRVIVDGVKQFRLDSELHRSAVCIIGNIARCARVDVPTVEGVVWPSRDDMLDSIIQTGAISILIGILLRHESYDYIVVNCVLVALRCMAAENDGVMEQLVLVGGIKATASIEKRGDQTTTEARLFRRCLEGLENKVIIDVLSKQSC